MAPERGDDDAGPVARFRPLTEYREQPADEMRRRAIEIADELRRRRTVRDFSDRRPAREKPFLLLVTGYPAPDARVPELTKKPLDGIASFV